MKVSLNHLHKYYKEIRDWHGYKNISETWELCENCIDLIEAVMQREAKRIVNLNGEPFNDIYTDGHGIEVGGLT